MPSNKELFEALNLIEKEKGIPADYLMKQIQRGITTACKNIYENENVEVTMNPEKYTYSVKLIKDVVEEVENPHTQISLDDAREISKRAAVGKTVKISLNPKEFARKFVEIAKSVIRQGIKDGEKGQMLIEFQSKEQEIVSAVVERVDPETGNATIRFGKATATLQKKEQIGDEVLTEGSTIKVYVAGVSEGQKGPRAIISRTHPEFVKRLFETEVPEIKDGIVEIKSISREAGSRTKMAVYSEDENIDAVGACIGTKGARVNAIVNELNGEKIDIVLYSDNPAEYVAASLSPATCVGIEMAEDGSKSCRAEVPDGQLSLAIGNKGQNVRLAAKLTGYKIDIHPESGFYGEDNDKTDKEDSYAEESEDSAAEKSAEAAAEDTAAEITEEADAEEPAQDIAEDASEEAEQAEE